jgi:hypothetical protein
MRSDSASHFLHVRGLAVRLKRSLIGIGLVKIEDGRILHRLVQNVRESSGSLALTLVIISRNAASTCASLPALALIFAATAIAISFSFFDE